MVAIDWSISVGNILTILTLLVTIAGGYIRLMMRVDRMELKFVGMSEATAALAVTVTKIGTLLTQSAILEHRLDRAEQDIHDLKRGEGFVLPLGPARKAESTKG
jgi:hypothetical protein